MKQLAMIAASAAFLALTTIVMRAQQDNAGPVGPLASSAGQETEISITAKKYEFDPNLIIVKQGEHVKLVITAVDRDHGIKLAAFNIDERLKKRVPTTVEFTADKVGTFPFECSVVCGLGHHKMKGKLVVEGTPSSSD